jgi:hypothetical protein
MLKQNITRFLICVLHESKHQMRLSLQVCSKGMLEASFSSSWHLQVLALLLQYLSLLMLHHLLPLSLLQLHLFPRLSWHHPILHLRNKSNFVVIHMILLPWHLVPLLLPLVSLLQLDQEVSCIFLHTHHHLLPCRFA